MTDTNSSHNPQELTEQQIREIKDELNLVQRMLDHKIKGFPSQTTEDQLTTMKGEAKLFKEIIDRHMKHYPDGRPTNPNLPRIEILTEAIKTALLYRNEIKNRLKPFEAAREIPNGNQYRLWERPEQNNESHSNMGLESTRQWRTHAYIPSNQSDKKFSDRMLTMVQHFDGSFKNFPEFIQNFNTFVDKTNACDDTKLCCFRKFLDPFSKAMIAGMNNYVESYLKICDYYSNPSLIKEEVIKDLRKLPDIHDYRQVKKMVDNLAIIRTKYNQLASIPEHRSFMEREFLGLISRKFPREVLEKSTHLIRHPNRIHTFMTDAEIFVDNWQEDFATREAEYYYSERVMNPGPSHHQPERYPHDRRNNRNYFHNNQRNRQPMSRPFQNQNNRLNYAPQQNQHEQQNQNQAQARAPSCVFCGGEHPQRDCQLSVTEKKANLLASGRCELCLQRGHRRQDCRARRPTCHRCKGEHLFWLCPRLITGQTNTSNQNNQRPPTAPEVNVITLPTPGLTQIAIQINKTPSLAMFDTGATHCIMNEEQCKLLGLKLQPGELPIKTANQQTKAIGTVDVKLKIGVIKRNHTFVVMPDANYCVLGVDAIRKFKLARSPYGKIDQIIASEAYKIKTRQCPGKGGDANQIEINSVFEARLQQLLDEYQESFAQTKGEVGQVRNDKCYINLENNIPINQKPYRTSVVDQKRIDAQVNDLLERNLIRRSTSDYSFPVVLVNKKDEGEKSRLCVDFRKLNTITIPERYPMPNIKDIEDRLLGAKIFATLDISSGFHHIPVAEEDRRKTAFVTMHEHFEWNVMPFGLKNAPAIFQRIVYNILKRNGLTEFAHNYIDDIIIFSKSEEDHLVHVEKVLAAVQRENLKLKLSKCHFMKKTVTYLGHHISENQICPLNSNVAAINEYPPPTDKKTLRRFLGKINFYHRFIPDRTKNLDPFYELLKKDKSFEWSAEKQAAFIRIKEIITSELVLHIFDPNKKTILITDASDIGIGAVLKQEHDGQEVPVGYFSRKLLKHQRNYVVTEKEALAIIEAVEYWHHYLYGRKFTIRTDHKPLKYINTYKRTNTRVMNWAMRLNQYEFDIGYIKGETNQEADFLSRNPSFEVNVLSLDRLEVLHRPLLQNPPRGCVKYNNHIVKVRKDVRRYYLPEQEALQELRRIHEEKGHLGMVKTNQHFALKYFANKQNDLVMKIVNGCDICKRAKKQIRKYGEIDKLGPATEPLQIVHIDTKGGFSEPRVKTRYLHIAIDAFSRFIWIRASQHQNSQDYLNLLQQIEEDGTPSKIVTDRYGAFKSDRFRSVLRTKSIVLVHTPTAHPQSNGLVERVGQTIVEKLRCKRLIDETRSWSALAKEVADEYNHTIHSSTKFTPAYLLAGRDPDEIYHGHDLNNDRKSALEHSQSAYQKEFKRIVQKQIPWKLKLGDMVYADLADELNKKILDPVYRGPFKVINKISEVMFEIKLPDRTEKVHIGKLKPFVPAVGIGDDE